MREKIIAKWQDYIKKHAKRWAPSLPFYYRDWEDLYQEGLIVLLKLYDKYSKTEDILSNKFGEKLGLSLNRTYLDICTRKKETKQFFYYFDAPILGKRSVNEYTYGLASERSWLSIIESEIVKDPMFDIQEFVDRINNQLSDKLKRLFEDIISSIGKRSAYKYAYSYIDLGKKYGVTRACIKSRLNKIRLVAKKVQEKISY